MKSTLFIFPFIDRLLMALAALVCGGALAADAEIGPIARHVAVFDKPPRLVPTRGMTDGPLLGNGDVGVVLGGPASEQLFYIGKNDFWSSNPAMVKSVGMVRLAMPALQDATYRQEQDLARAEVRGVFTKNETTVRTRSWVAASENLLVSELICQGPAPVTVTLDQQVGGVQPIDDKNQHVNIGREGNGQGRWYFDGIIDDLRIYDLVLSAEEIQAWAAGRAIQQAPVLNWPASAPAGAQATSGEAVAGKVGQTMRFDGKSTFIDAGPLRVNKVITIGAWLNPAHSNRINYIVSKGEWICAYSLGLLSGRIRMAIGDSYAETTETVIANRWQHVVGVYDGRTISVYVDGVLKAVHGGDRMTRECDAQAGRIGFSLQADHETLDHGRMVSVATRVLGATTRTGGEGQLYFELKPDQVVQVVTAVASDLDAREHLAAVKQRVAELGAKEISDSSIRHRTWWSEFWSRSSIRIPDQLIEKYWYGALYILGSCSRDGRVAPGLWANWITTDSPKWQGDYTLNYNFQAPYYIAYSANHVDLTRPFNKAIVDFMPKGFEMARNNGWKGVHYPTHIGPWALMPEGWRDHGQRSNAAQAALNFIWYYAYTQDRQWLKTTGYPYLVEVANFWEDYLKLENGRYVILNDSIHEGSGTDRNNVLSLGLVRTLFRAILTYSRDLDIDADRRTKWQDILERLSDYPLMERKGKTVFRYTEKGTEWWPNCALGIQHIYPAGAIGLESDTKLVEISRNMITEMGRWVDGNHFSSFYTAAARVGYDPSVILKHLREQSEGKYALPNLILSFGGGGIESCGGFLVLNEMLLQSHEGVLKLFPCWPRDQAASFTTLRAYGAFLVSAELEGGEVADVTILSEKGTPCTVQNPWPGREVTLVRNGTKAETLRGDRFTFATTSGERVALMRQ